MTFRFKKNLLSTGIDGAMIYEFKEFMKSTPPTGPGWTITLSSNGSTYGAADYITSKSVLTVNNSWFVLQDPAGERELMFQHTSGGYYYIIRYSASAGFTGGTATVAPTATDQQIILANSSGTGGTSFLPYVTTNTVVTQFGADDSDGYSFFMAPYTLEHEAVGSIGGLYMDLMASGSYSVVNDLDPVVFCVGYFTSAIIGSISATYSASRCVSWFNKGTGSEVFTVCPGGKYRNLGINVCSGNMSQNFDSKKTFLLPIPYMKLNYFKGIGKNFKWNPFSSFGTSFDSCTSGSRFYTKTLDNDKLLIGDVVFPWDGTNVL
jgi:hypothetical protein